MAHKFVIKMGGDGSGNFGHGGRPGERGGSGEGSGDVSDWEKRVRAEEDRGATRSDAQAIIDAEDSKVGRARGGSRTPTEQALKDRSD